MKVKDIFDAVGLQSCFTFYELEAFHEVVKCITTYKQQDKNKYFPSSLFEDMMWASFPKTSYNETINYNQ